MMQVSTVSVIFVNVFLLHEKLFAKCIVTMQTDNRSSVTQKLEVFKSIM